MLRGIPRVTTDYLHFYFVGGYEPSTTPSEGNTTDFTVSIANQSSKLPVLSYGPAGDQISILSDKNSKKRFTTDSGGATATFSGAAANDSRFYAISPFRDDNLTLNGNFISGVTIPDYQWSDNWGSGGTGQSWDPAAPLAYAVTEGENLQFHNLCAILKIRATGSWAGYFRILAFGGDLAGTFDLYTPTGELISSNFEAITRYEASSISYKA